MTDGVGVVAAIREPVTGDRPVVLLHGLSQQRRFWAPVVRRLRTQSVIALDQRGHGESDAAVDADFRISRAADDLAEVLDALGVQQAHVVGHSWGASVALRFAAQYPERVLGVAMVDGGPWVRPEAFDRPAALERLRPPELGIPVDDLWRAIASGDLAESWSEEIRDALEPTFVVDPAGRIRTRIGVDRHMAVLEAMLDYDPWADVPSLVAPAWVVRCIPSGATQDPQLRRTLDRLAPTPVLVHQWQGACHDVPLQWPALVAGFVDALVESARREESR